MLVIYLLRAAWYSAMVCELSGVLGRKSIAIAKRSFNASTEHIRGIGSLGMQALSLYYNTDESKEGVQAFLEKRPPDWVVS